MNQILDYNPNKSSGGGSSGSDKVVRVFAVLLACFALCLLGLGGYELYKNQQKTEVQVQAPTQAKISVSKGQTTATIKVSHDKAIEKIIYRWDSDKESTIKGSGESSMESEIPLLAGTHVLNIKVTDIDGVESTYTEEIESTEGEDKMYPVIAVAVTDEKKLKITATDETAIDFVTYRWNDEEEQRVDVSEEDNKKIEFEIDILKGQNDLLIVAVDKNNNNTTETNSFTGVTKPDVKITISADKKLAEVICTHENGIKEIKLNINNEEQIVDLGGETPKEVPFSIEFVEANNVMTVTAVSVDETQTVATEEVISESADEIDISIEQSADKPEVANAFLKTNTGIKEIKLNINDMDYMVDIGTETPPELTLEIPLVEGNNKITLKVITINDVEKEEIKEITR